MATIPNAGDVIIEGDTATLVFTRMLHFPPEAVWAAITDPAQLRQWFMTTASIDGRPGGAVDLVSGPSRFHVTGTILAWEPPRLFEHEWNVAARDELPGGEQATVRWELRPMTEGTELTVSYKRLSRNTALGFAPGMHAFLDRLETQLAGTTLPDWMRRFGEVQSAYPSWER